MTTEFLIDAEFQERMFQTSEVCDEELERSILESGGPQDALHVAEIPAADGSSDSVSVLMDGHRRFGICQKHSLPYSVIRKRFPSRADALAEMDSIQLRRRNLNPTQEGIVRARLFEHRMEKSPEVGVEAALKEVAEESGVSTRTVRRDVDSAKKLEKIAPDLRDRARDELSRSDIRRLASLTEDDQHEIVAQFDSGEFTSIKAAMEGESSVDDVIEKPKRTPAAEGEKEAAQRALGKLQDAIHDLNVAFPDATNARTAKSYTDRLAGLLAAWGN